MSGLSSNSRSQSAVAHGMSHCHTKAGGKIASRSQRVTRLEQRSMASLAAQAPYTKAVPYGNDHPDRIYTVKCRKCGAQWTTQARSVQHAISRYEHYTTCPAGMHVALPTLSRYAVVIKQDGREVL